ncbi:MAG: YfhO family protein [Verrucomicrobiia bacterium]
MPPIKLTGETVEYRQTETFKPWQFALLLALLICAAFPQVVPGLQTFIVRDYGFFAYPLAHFQQDCYQRGELPFWNPYNNCGVPFLAQWNTMPLYPLSMIYLALPLHWSLGFFCLLHLWFAGLGMYFLARRWTDDSLAAAFAGTAFTFNGLTLNLLMWPSHTATMSWMPWVVLAVESAWRVGGRKIILAALAGAMQMLAGGPEITFLTWLFLLALWMQQFFHGEAPRLGMLWRFPLMVALVISLAAVQLLPFLDLVAHAQRETGFADMRWSMPGWGWVNFLVPMSFGSTATEGVFFQHGQYWTSSYYLGMGTLWLALLALLGVSERRVRLLGTAAAIALLFAFGENTPVYPELRKLFPQLSLITYPIKFVLVIAFVAPLLAGFALVRLQQLQKRIVSVGVVLFALLTAILFWAWRSPFPADDIRATLLNGGSRALFLAATGFLLLVLAREFKPGFRRLAPLVLIVVAWLDVYTHEPTQNPTVPPWIYQTDLARDRLALTPQPAPGKSRVMVSPLAVHQFLNFAAHDPKNNFLAKRMSYCANCNLLDDAPKVDGFFSLTPRESDDVLSLLYATTNTDFPQLEDFLCVSHITAPDEIFHWQSRPTFLPFITAGQKPVFLDDAATLHALTQPDFDGSKMVFLPPETRTLVAATNPASVRMISSRFTPERVDAEVESSQPTVVVVSQSYYHNWQASLDGQPVPLLRANHAFQAVAVPAGRHGVKLVYQDQAFKTGAAISVCMWISCLIGLRLMRERGHPYGSHSWEPDSPV